MTALHLIGLPHTRLDGGFSTCAYTQKVAKLRRMNLGRDLTVYAGPGADVELISETERLLTYGPDNPGSLPGWPTDEQWLPFNARAIAELAQRANPDDLVLLAGGYSQRLIQDSLPHLTFCEPGVGYEGITTPFCAFESYAWRHHVYGIRGIRDGRWLDAVIPNYFDPDEFPHVSDGHGDYLLFLGRVTLRKGPHIASEIAKAAKMKLVIAGPGVTSNRAERRRRHIVGDHVEITGSHLNYVGPVGVAERATLLAGARALVCPTFYMEPFGGVAVEAMMAGTPVIAPDWGAFTETVVHGQDGFRFRTLADAAEAVEAVGALDNAAIRESAISRYSLDAVAPMFQSWFRQLEHVRERGWYALPTTPRRKAAA